MDNLELGQLLLKLKYYLDDDTQKCLVTYIPELGPRNRESLSKSKNTADLLSNLQTRSLIKQGNVKPLMELIKNDTNLAAIMQVLSEYQEKADDEANAT